MKVLALKFSIGRTISGMASLKEVSFYKWLSSSITGDAENSIVVADKYSIPVTNKDIVNGINAIAPTIDKVIKELDSIKLIDVIIVDIQVSRSGVARATILEYILDGIKSVINNARSGALSNVIILNEYVPHQNDVLWRSINTIYGIPGVQVLIFNEKGNCSIPIALEPDLFVLKRLEAGPSPEEEIRDRMIKQLGHFRKSVSGREVCVRHFYDGSQCKQDISRYLWRELHQSINPDSCLIYHSMRSPWLRDSVLRSDLRCSKVSYDDKKTIDKYDHFVIVADFIDTGSSLTDYIDSLPVKPSRTITIIATKEKLDREGRLILTSKKYGSIEVEYILLADYDQIGETPCELCDIELPVDALSHMSYLGQLRSIDFWQMLGESGLCPERDPPGNREPLRNIIDTKKFVATNSGFLASRVEQIKDYYGLPDDVTFVYPDEKNVEGSASQDYAIQLEKILHHDSIPIPRAVINAVMQRGKDALDNLTEEVWVQELSKSSIRDCIVVDDISMSGQTIVGLVNILEAMEKNVVASIPILFLGGGESLASNELLVPLYEWNLKDELKH